MKRHFSTVVLIALLILLATDLGQSAGWDPKRDQKLKAAAEETIQAFKDKDPDIQAFFDEAYGYAVFPSVGKGGIGLGGAHGRGLVYQQGSLTGRSKMTQFTVGLQLGGQKFSEIIFFKDKTAMDHFKNGNFEFDANASAVALKSGASASASYDKGVAVFSMALAGLMYEATVGGQKFSFEPVN